VSLLDSRLALLNPKLEETREARNHQQADGRTRPTGHTTAMRVVDDRHDNAQGRSDRRNHVTNPINQVEERSLGLGCSLSLDSLVGRRCSAKVLSLNKQRKELKEND
jgi:hypothetical protein